MSASSIVIRCYQSRDVGIGDETIVSAILPGTSAVMSEPSARRNPEIGWVTRRLGRNGP